jgi:hypothetical protein
MDCLRRDLHTDNPIKAVHKHDGRRADLERGRLSEVAHNAAIGIRLDTGDGWHDSKADDATAGRIEPHQ